MIKKGFGVAIYLLIIYFLIMLHFFYWITNVNVFPIFRLEEDCSRFVLKQPFLMVFTLSLVCVCCFGIVTGIIGFTTAPEGQGSWDIDSDCNNKAADLRYFIFSLCSDSWGFEELLAEDKAVRDGRGTEVIIESADLLKGLVTEIVYTVVSVPLLGSIWLTFLTTAGAFALLLLKRWTDAELNAPIGLRFSLRGKISKLNDGADPVLGTGVDRDFFTVGTNSTKHDPEELEERRTRLVGLVSGVDDLRLQSNVLATVFTLFVEVFTLFFGEILCTEGAIFFTLWIFSVVMRRKEEFSRF